MSFFNPLSPEQHAKLIEALEESARAIKEHEERQKQEPRLSFIRGAIACGFSEAQAEFLWIHQPREHWLL